MNIVETLLGMTLLGAEWVLWLLVLLSIVSIAIIIERAYYFYKIRLDFSRFTQNLSNHLASQDSQKIEQMCKEEENPVGEVS